MDLFIVRHGEAVDEAPSGADADRWLTAKGRDVTRRVARWLAEDAARRPAAIWTSPLVRAVQTAELVAGIVTNDDVSVAVELTPGGDLDRLLKRVAKRDGSPLAFVGHEPSLSALAKELLGDVAWQGFKKSGVCKVSWAGKGHARFEWLLVPKDMRVVTSL